MAVIAVARALPPLARATAGGTRRLFNPLKRAVIYLCGFRWPTALIWFLLTFGIFIVQTQPDIGFILMFLGAPFWSVATDLIASRAERLADAAAIALTTRQDGRDSQIWSDLMLTLSHADFARVGPRFVDAVLARWTDALGRHVGLGDRLTRRLVDLGPVAQPLLERIRSPRR